MGGEGTMLIFATRWQCFAPFCLINNQMCSITVLSATPAGSEICSLHHGLLQFSCDPTLSGHIKDAQYFSEKWDTVSFSPNEDHTVVGPHHAVFICTARQWWSKPYEQLNVSAETQWRGRPPTATHCSLFSSLLGQAAFLGALGMSAEEGNIIHKDQDTTAYATFISSPNHQKGT